MAGSERRVARPRRGAPGVLIIVQNLPVPLDRRVWLESRALCADGARVTVICPTAPGLARHEVLDGIAIYRYPPPPEARNALGFLVEFVWCWLLTAMLSVVVKVREGFDVIQACNPPDTYWLLAKLWRAAGVRFVYDQHDLNPEVLLSRFGRPAGAISRLQLRFLLWLERHSYWTADEIIVTNRSYRDAATLRGMLDPAKITIVRSGPDTTAMVATERDPSVLRGHRHLAVYLGIMGPQDGVHNVLLALEEIVHGRGRTDCAVALLGFGDCFDELVALTAELGLEDHVTFTGRVDATEITRYLSSADLGLGPDPYSPLNNVSTMNKTMEYMAFGLPVVSFDLNETRVSAAGAGIFVAPGDISAFADEWCALLDDAPRRARLGRVGRQRAVHALDWSIQAARYVSVYRRVLGYAEPLDDRDRVDDDGIARVPVTIDDDGTAWFPALVQPRGARVQPVAESGAGGASRFLSSVFEQRSAAVQRNGS